MSLPVRFTTHETKQNDWRPFDVILFLLPPFFCLGCPLGMIAWHWIASLFVGVKP